ncbi:MAG: hypothetical protein NC253_14495 [Ruminococcus sp.]|nr:hypothetical protein [Ruminococcus sp.]MCM1380782.1 hypothetical protein [Muribaculaceae bacterium]MCM1480176.1 hypothetical protein [Muribaculaceae bacterium]
MGAEKSWSGMRKYLEEDMLANSLKNRVRYSCTKFPEMDGGGLFRIYVDNKPVKDFSLETLAKYSYNLHNGERPVGADFWRYWDDELDKPLDERAEFDDSEFAGALYRYRNSDIFDVLYGGDPIARMFAVLDRRVGKRTLRSLKDEVSRQPEWLAFFYKLRLEAENIR